MVNRNKAKGSNTERELIAMFWENGWAAIRIAGSGSSRYPCPDVLASNSLRRIAIECKFVKEDKKYFEKSEIEQLEIFAEKFGAEPWIGIKFSRKDWHFIKTNQLRNTKEMLSANLELCKEKGILFQQLIQKINPNITQN